jgi:predicted HTH domain antitoxin
MPTLDLPPHVDEARARLLLAVALFQEEGLTVGQAAEVAGLSYRAFADALVERGVPPYPADEDPATLAAEMETVMGLIRDVEGRG